MHSAIQEAKIRADLILARAKTGDASTLSRFKSLQDLKHLPLGELARELSRKHALTLIARELGFPNWPLAKQVLSGDHEGTHFGDLLYPKACFGFLNNWYADYEEARAQRDHTNGFLLAYRRQYFVVGAQYIQTMGLDPHDEAWSKMGWDWARPKDLAARTQLYAQLLSEMKRETVVSGQERSVST